jgi:hypothetical protein
VGNHGYPGAGLVRPAVGAAPVSGAWARRVRHRSDCGRGADPGRRCSGVHRGERSRGLQKRLEPGVGYNEGQLDDDLWGLNPVDEGLNYFINHSCDPNSTGEVVRRDIAAGEEVTMDYTIEMDGDYELAPCRCGTARCRGRVTGSDWQRPELQKRYGEEFPPYLRRRMS